MRRALALAGFAVPNLGNQGIRACTSLWFRCALALAVISVPVLIGTTFFAFITLALASLRAPALVQSASARISAFAIAEFLYPGCARRTFLWQTHALARNNVQVVTSMALGDVACLEKFFNSLLCVNRRVRRCLR